MGQQVPPEVQEEDVQRFPPWEAQSHVPAHAKGHLTIKELGREGLMVLVDTKLTMSQQYVHVAKAAVF